MKKILITGTSGFIGRNLCEQLAGKYEILLPGRTELDLMDDGSVRSYLAHHPVDAVIHTAGKPGHRNVNDPHGVFFADCRMFFNLSACREHYGRLIITGSGGIYDLRHYQPRMKEEHAGVNIPADEHGLFRYVTSRFIADDPKTVDLRIFGIFGKYEDYAIRFISNAICKALFDLPITMRQNRLFDYLFVDDLAPIITYFIEHDAAYRAYNVTPDRSAPLLALAEKVRAVSGKELPIVVAQEGMGPPYTGDNARLRSEMPGVAFTPIDSAIERLFGWYRDNINLIDRNLLLVDK